MSLRQRHKRRNKPPSVDAKEIGRGCSGCGHPKISRSPTGDWCNNCGRQWPCQCWIKDHKGCFDHMVKKSKENNLKIPASCCCGKHKG